VNGSPLPFLQFSQRE